MHGVYLITGFLTLSTYLRVLPPSPWVANAIGKGNRHYFLLLIWLNLYAALISAVIGGIQV